MSNDHDMETRTLPLSDPEPLLTGEMSSWLKDSATNRLDHWHHLLLSPHGIESMRPWFLNQLVYSGGSSQ